MEPCPMRMIAFASLAVVAASIFGARAHAAAMPVGLALDDVVAPLAGPIGPGIERDTAMRRA